MNHGQGDTSKNSDIIKPRAITQNYTKPKLDLPCLHKVLLLNDDYTPREYGIAILRTVFRISEDEAYNIMMTVHKTRAA